MTENGFDALSVLREDFLECIIGLGAGTYLASFTSRIRLARQTTSDFDFLFLAE
jgi:hypothetical protein